MLIKNPALSCGLDCWRTASLPSFHIIVLFSLLLAYNPSQPLYWQLICTNLSFINFRVISFLTELKYQKRASGIKYLRGKSKEKKKRESVQKGKQLHVLVKINYFWDVAKQAGWSRVSAPYWVVCPASRFWLWPLIQCKCSFHHSPPLVNGNIISAEAGASW